MLEYLGADLLNRRQSRELLSKDWGIECEVWNVTSFSELRKDAEEVERWNTLHPSEDNKKSYLEKCIANDKIPTVAVSDYIKMVGEQISSYTLSILCPRNRWVWTKR